MFARWSAGLRVGRIAGIPITLAPSSLISVLLIVVLAGPVVSDLVPTLSATGTYLVAVALALALQVSVLAHELGHCIAAQRMGVEVIEVRLFLLGGVSEIARLLRSPREEARIAAAGPAVSILLSGMFFGLTSLTTSYTVWWLLALELAWANAIVAIFNLIPALPLDGGRVLRAGIWSRTGHRSTGTKAAAVGGYVVAAALIAWGVYQVVTGGRAGLLQALVAAAMAYFVALGARAEAIADTEPVWPVGMTVQTLARPAVQLAAETPLELALQSADGAQIILIGAEGVAVGLVDERSALSLVARSPRSPVSAVAFPVTSQNVLLFSDSPSDVELQLRSAPTTLFLLIGQDGHPQGVLRREDIPRAKSAGRDRRTNNQ